MPLWTAVNWRGFASGMSVGEIAGDGSAREPGLSIVAAVGEIVLADPAQLEYSFPETVMSTVAVQTIAAPLISVTIII